MKDLYYWLVEHPDVKVEFERNTEPLLHVEVTMTYKEKSESSWIMDRNLNDGLYKRRLIDILNNLYKECGGELFIDSLGLPTKEYNSLCRSGLMDYADFNGLTIAQLAKIRGFGPTALNRILTALTEKGFLLRNGIYVRKYVGEPLDDIIFCTLAGGMPYTPIEHYRTQSEAVYSD